MVERSFSPKKKQTNKQATGRLGKRYRERNRMKDGVGLRFPRKERKFEPSGPEPEVSDGARGGRLGCYLTINFKLRGDLNLSLSPLVPPPPSTPLFCLNLPDEPSVRVEVFIPPPHIKCYGPECQVYGPGLPEKEGRKLVRESSPCEGYEEWKGGDKMNLCRCLPFPSTFQY
ncbi:hypothetical protein IE53DRAFT_159348 [Violaceomyces palustris]|uniref:Uncharacterized protein n=1 Tax=Violaceomyces palustris TaxID=1673888 RepID=A0ACD0NTN9_9BASI|nr:hypothetical protein IE53DRAFT_159348 [Violaceomyces palustris]